MAIAIYLVLMLFGAAVLYLVVRAIVRAYLEYRGQRVIRCPENRDFAAVELDAKRAAVTRALGEPDLRLESCTRWPERRGCGQECLRQIEDAPAECLLRNILTRWYQGKNCVYCGKSLDEIHWLEHKPAVRNPDGVTLEWHEFPPEKVFGVLETHRPVCWNCHIAETFRHLHPELVVDRPSREPHSR